MSRWMDRVPYIAAVVGALALIELLAETRLGLGSLTTGSPLSFRGVLIELPGGIWFLVLLLLELAAPSFDEGRPRKRLNLYIFAWTILGLAAAVWALVNANPSVRTNWQYWTAFGCVGLAFVVAGFRELASPKDLLRCSPRDILSSLFRDIRVLGLRRSSWLLLVGSICLIAFAPKANAVPSRREPVLRGQALIDWFDRQPRRALPADYVKGAVVVATFVDYQCPACLSAEQSVTPVFLELSRRFGETLRFVTLDFPLERECNGHPGVPETLHPLACETAAVVRMAKERSKPTGPLVQWLWEHQAELTRERIFEAAKKHSGVDDVESLYSRALEDVRRDAAIAYEIGVRSTPSYWINGVVTRRRSAEDMRALILHEVQRVTGVRARW